MGSRSGTDASPSMIWGKASVPRRGRSTRSSNPRSRQEENRGDIIKFIVPALGYLIIFSIFPLFYSLGISFFDFNQMKSKWNFVGFRNFTEVLQDPVFWSGLRVSLIMLVVGVSVQVFFGTSLAIFFGQKLRGAKFIRALLIIPMILNPIVVGLMWRALLNPQWGIINWLLSIIGVSNPPIWFGNPKWALWSVILVDIWQWTPFVFVIVFARYQSLPTDIFEAARVDGAGPWRIIRSVTLPMLTPAIAFAAIFRGIDSFRNFDLVYGITYGGPGRVTTNLSFYTFENGFTFLRYGYASALAIVMVIIASIGFSILLKLMPTRRSDTR